MADVGGTYAERLALLHGMPLTVGVTTVPTALPSHLLNTTCDVYRPTVTADTAHSPVGTFAAIYTSVPCRVQPRSGSESDVYGRLSGQTDIMVYYSSSYTILAADRIVTNSRTLEVIGIVRFDMGDLVKAICREVL